MAPALPAGQVEDDAVIRVLQRRQRRVAFHRDMRGVLRTMLDQEAERRHPVERLTIPFQTRLVGLRQRMASAAPDVHDRRRDVTAAAHLNVTSRSAGAWITNVRSDQKLSRLNRIGGLRCRPPAAVTQRRRVLGDQQGGCPRQHVGGRERHSEVPEAAAEHGHADHRSGRGRQHTVALAVVERGIGLQVGRLLGRPAPVAREDAAAESWAAEELTPRRDSRLRTGPHRRAAGCRCRPAAAPAWCRSVPGRARPR